MEPIQSWLIALGAILGPTIGGVAAFVSWSNSRHAAILAQRVEVVREHVQVVERKMDGPLAALIDSIKAKALADIAVAEAHTSRRIADAFAAGQEQPHTPDPAMTQAIAVEAVRAARTDDGT